MEAARSRRRGVTSWRTKREIAVHFRKSPRCIERWMKDAGFPFSKPFEHGSVLFPLEECEEWFRGR